MALIYKILAAADWRAMQATGRYDGSADDRRDGFIHLSSREQLAGTLAKHFQGQDNLLLLAVDDSALAATALKWEPSRGGALFPHLYAPLPLSAVAWAEVLTSADDGSPVLPSRMMADG
ncbi:MAG: DUF952 domain-containing protein [Sphingomonadales bacterium]